MFGTHIKYYSRLDSTNAEAWRLIRSEEAKEGMIIHAGFQIAGKGQVGASWESEEGKNLLISCITKPDYIAPAAQFNITKAVSLAVVDSIRSYLTGCEISIKWPNDIYAEDKKIAGVLIENSIMGDHIEFCVIGIGINVNQTEFVTDAPNPTSVKMIAGIQTETGDFLQIICEKLNKWLDLLKSGLLPHIHTAYLNQLFGYGQEKSFKAGGRLFRGVIKDVDPYGKLMLDHDGWIHSYDMKEICFC